MKILIGEESLCIELDGLEKVWALQGSLTVPLRAVTGVSAREPGNKPRNYWAALRLPGTFVPWVIKAGTYYTAQGREFWYATWRKGFLVIDLADAAYSRVVLGIDNPEVWAQRIRGAAPSGRL